MRSIWYTFIGITSYSCAWGLELLFSGKDTKFDLLNFIPSLQSHTASANTFEDRWSCVSLSLFMTLRTPILTPFIELGRGQQALCLIISQCETLVKRRRQWIPMVGTVSPSPSSTIPSLKGDFSCPFVTFSVFLISICLYVVFFWTTKHLHNQLLLAIFQRLHLFYLLCSFVCMIFVCFVSFLRFIPF